MRRVLADVRREAGGGFASGSAKGSVGDPDNGSASTSIEGSASHLAESSPLVLVALSGGADSLALAAAVAFETGVGKGRSVGSADAVRAGAVVVDHGLQAGSAAVAESAAAQARELGLDPVLVRRVEVRGVVDAATNRAAGAGTSDAARAAGHTGTGPEAAARDARYEALAEIANETGAVAILTAHTRDDQAEQVILALARGSGLRSVAGIPRKRSGSSGVVILRPFLIEEPEITRAATELACAAEGLEFWSDPHNVDPSYARVRVRRRVLPLLENELGPGVAAALARTADLAREDADALDEIAEGLLRELVAPAATPAQPGPHFGLTSQFGLMRNPGFDQPEAQNQPGVQVPQAGDVADRVADAVSGDVADAMSGEITLPVAALAALPAALRNRVIRRVATREFGAHLSREHTLAVAALVTDWRGQGPINIPGTVVTRESSALVFRALNSLSLPR